MKQIKDRLNFIRLLSQADLHHFFYCVAIDTNYDEIIATKIIIISQTNHQLSLLD